MKKGFTLLEMTGVIAILALVAIIAIPNIITTLKKSDNDKSNQYKKIIENGAEIYVSRNTNLFKNRINSNQTFYIKIKDVVDSGNIQSTLINHSSNLKVIDDLGCIKIFKESEVLKYEYQDANNPICAGIKTLED